MLPAYFDPIVPGLVPAFAATMRAEFACVGAAALIGVAAVVCLVVLELLRTRSPRRACRTPTPQLRRAA
jgi:hypothetical protein